MFTVLITTLLIAMVPVLELRGAIPIGVSLGLHPIVATFVAIIGNFLPILPILLLLTKIFDFLRERKFSKKFIAKLEERVEKKRDVVDKYGWLGLIILVAIPLPGTGAWTGALVAGVLEMKTKTAALAIAAGILIAGLVVSLVTFGAVSIFS